MKEENNLEEAVNELSRVLIGNKSKDTNEIYIKNAIRFINAEINRSKGGNGMNSTKKLQVRIDEYVYGVWFDTVDINPFTNTVKIYDHLFNKTETFSEEDSGVMYREVEVTE